MSGAALTVGTLEVGKVVIEARGLRRSVGGRQAAGKRAEVDGDLNQPRDLG